MRFLSQNHCLVRSTLEGSSKPRFIVEWDSGSYRSNGAACRNPPAKAGEDRLSSLRDPRGSCTSIFIPGLVKSSAMYTHKCRHCPSTCSITGAQPSSMLQKQFRFWTSTSSPAWTQLLARGKLSGKEAWRGSEPNCWLVQQQVGPCQWEGRGEGQRISSFYSTAAKVCLCRISFLVFIMLEVLGTCQTF